MVTSVIYKIPESVLVVIYTPGGEVLLIRRTDAGTCQSVSCAMPMRWRGSSVTLRRL